ncbi:MAG: hypothetical protein HYX32_12465 [Actinobacteria bacterium]|nr:hypothetical protein [Actinomycetota bacterium]
MIIDDKPWSTIRFLEFDLDIEMGDDTFQYSAPPGVVVQTPSFSSGPGVEVGSPMVLSADSSAEMDMAFPPSGAFALSESCRVRVTNGVGIGGLSRADWSRTGGR